MTRNYLEAFILVIVTAGFGYYLTLPKYTELKDVEQKISEKEAENKARLEYYANLEKISAEIDDNGEALIKIKSAFPDNVDSPALMNFIQAAAMQSGLVLKTIGYSAADRSAVPESAAVNNAGDATKNVEYASKKVLSQYGVSATLMGKYSDLKIFLSRIQSSSRLIGVGKIDINSAGKAADTQGEDKDKKTTGAEQTGADQTLGYSLSFLVNYYK